METIMPSFHHLLIQDADEVRTITLNRPDKRNALCPLLMQEISQAFSEAEDSDCRVVILTGAGPAFCAGLDMEHLSTLHATTEEEGRRDSENMANVLRTLYEFPKPVIAAVNGPAIAGGMGLAILADFTLAVPEAKFGFTEVKLGYVPALVASFLLRHVGEKVTRELLLSGRLIKAQEAYHLHLVTQIVDSDELIQTAYAHAQGLLQNSPQAMREIKLLLATHSKRRLDEEIEDAIEVNARQRSAEDFREGVQAFLKHRKPEWPSLHSKV
jgi:methylglutaconyl-CoA hydratase